MPLPVLPLHDGHTIPAIAYCPTNAVDEEGMPSSTDQGITTGALRLYTTTQKPEAIVSQTIPKSWAGKRSELFVSASGSPKSISRETPPLDTTASLEKVESLNYVDLWLVNSPLLDDWEDAVLMKKCGLARSIGVVDYSQNELEQLIEATGVVPAVNEISLDYYSYAGYRDLLEFHAKHGIITVAHDSFPYLEHALGFNIEPQPQRDAANRLEITPKQVVYLWLRSKGIAMVISDREEMEQICSIASSSDEKYQLTQEEIDGLEEAGRPLKLWERLIGWTAICLCIAAAAFGLYYAMQSTQRMASAAALVLTCTGLRTWWVDGWKKAAWRVLSICYYGMALSGWWSYPVPALALSVLIVVVLRVVGWVRARWAGPPSNDSPV